MAADGVDGARGFRVPVEAAGKPASTRRHADTSDELSTSSSRSKPESTPKVRRSRSSWSSVGASSPRSMDETVG